MDVGLGIWIGGFEFLVFLGGRCFWEEICPSRRCDLRVGHIVCRKSTIVHYLRKALVEIKCDIFGGKENVSCFVVTYANVRIHSSRRSNEMPESRELNQFPVGTATHPLVSLARSLACQPRSPAQQNAECCNAIDASLKPRYQNTRQPQPPSLIPQNPIHNTTAPPWQPV